MRKKIGIITTFKANNYGAELQAYALQKKLRDLGYDAELIDYLFYKNRKYKYTAGSEPWMNFTLMQRIKQFALYRIALPLIDVVGNWMSSKMRERTHNFESFHEGHSRLSQTYYSQKELYEAKMDYDVFVVGSDQVWNPNTAISISPYFLDFAPEKSKKISYASSFGVDRIPFSCSEQYKGGLNGLDHISCREFQGVELVKNLTGKEATHVLDPTLLLDITDWETISVHTYCPKKAKYILLYNIMEVDSVYQFAQRISSETGWPIIRLCKRAFFVASHKGVRDVRSAGPADFLGLIENSTIFITNSFHGCAFAINLKMLFWCILDKKASNNGRINSLLEKFKLQDRVIDLSDVENIDYLRSIDYTEAQKILEEEREKSLSYLISSIEN